MYQCFKPPFHYLVVPGPIHSTIVLIHMPHFVKGPGSQVTQSPLLWFCECHLGDLESLATLPIKHPHSMFGSATSAWAMLQANQMLNRSPAEFTEAHLKCFLHSGADIYYTWPSEQHQEGLRINISHTGWGERGGGVHWCLLNFLEVKYLLVFAW